MKRLPEVFFVMGLACLAYAIAVIAIGCAAASTNLFRTEQTLVNTGFAAWVGYTNALHTGTLKISVDDSNAVKQARLKLAASVGVVETYRVAYETNSSVKPYAQAAVDATIDNVSNLVWVINYVRSK